MPVWINQKVIGSGIVVLAVVLIGGYVFLQVSGPTYRPDDPGYNRAYWESRIQRKGVVATYQEFKTRTGELPFARQHFAAHVMGELIADTAGVDGITVCDSSFAFGCYHGLFTTLIAREGTDIVKELDTKCVATYGPLGTGCQHGIGHGILEYTGYEHLSDALSLCKNTTEMVPLLGCSSGVFMEYNAPLSGDPNALAPQPRPFDSDKPYTPCQTVEKKYQASCYFELGGWLKRNRTYEQVGKLCSALTGDDRIHCFMGVGAMIGPTEGYTVDHARAQCALFTPGDEQSCRAGLWWSLYQVPELRDQTAAACADTDPTITRSCEQRGDLTRPYEGR